ncbi:hypothetical protein O3M35_005420 [Rhynocoris fuscipes]|uniref:Uncharacterized protein n=1 Tax=Rhynocoris fuscipes TaxID=488301 RepID=A0AAW1DQB1_9HEMI
MIATNQEMIHVIANINCERINDEAKENKAMNVPKDYKKNVHDTEWASINSCTKLGPLRVRDSVVLRDVLLEGRTGFGHSFIFSDVHATEARS